MGHNNDKNSTPFWVKHVKTGLDTQGEKIKNNISPIKVVQATYRIGSSSETPTVSKLSQVSFKTSTKAPAVKNKSNKKDPFKK
jgi:hypothetical protein